MSQFEIPVKQLPVQQTSLSVENKELVEKLQGIPNNIIDSTYRYITSLDNTTEAKILEIKVENEATKRNYIRDVSLTYRMLTEAIQKAFETNKELKCIIKGHYNSCWSTPSMEYWRTCNPAATMVIDSIVFELKSKGWSPEVSLSESSVDHDDGMYSGGNELTITCNFS